MDLVVPLAKPGDVVSPPPDGTVSGRIAYATALAETAQECLDALDAAQAALTVNVVPAGLNPRVRSSRPDTGRRGEPCNRTRSLWTRWELVRSTRRPSAPAGLEPVAVLSMPQPGRALPALLAPGELRAHPHLRWRPGHPGQGAALLPADLPDTGIGDRCRGRRCPGRAGRSRDGQCAATGRRAAG